MYQPSRSHYLLTKIDAIVVKDSAADWQRSDHLDISPAIKRPSLCLVPWQPGDAATFHVDFLFFLECSVLLLTEYRLI